MINQKIKQFIVAKQDSYDSKYLIICKELNNFVESNIDAQSLQNIYPLNELFNKMSSSSGLFSQFLDKKLKGDFLITTRNLLGFHFLIISEKSDNIYFSCDSLMLTESFQNRFKRALYWKDIEIKSKILLDCLAKKDLYTAGHTKRVGLLCKELAERMNLSEYQSLVCYYSGLLHDIGKIAVDDAILKKQSSLSDDEFKVMRKHPTHSYEIVKDQINNQDIVDGIRFHHEKYDGSGYPQKLKGDQIPLASRIVAVADTFDALISHRPYRKGVPPVEAIDKLRKIAPGQLDESIVESFVEFVESSQMMKKRKKAA